MAFSSWDTSSACEIPCPRGVEQLEYELVFTGYSGPHRIEQLLDHDHANRFRIADFGPDGVMQSATSEDSVAGRVVR